MRIEEIYISLRRYSLRFDNGYASRLRPYRSLLYAYINAKAPAYGFRERMKADNVTPNANRNNLLSRADVFIKLAVAELLE